MRDHLLLDGQTYRRLSDADCSNHKLLLEQEIKEWIKKYNKTLTKMEHTFPKTRPTTKQKSIHRFLLNTQSSQTKTWAKCNTSQELTNCNMSQ